MLKFLIKFFGQLADIFSYIENRLRHFEFVERYYVYVPGKDKPRYVHFSYSSAKQEANRIKKLLEQKDEWETVQILQILDEQETDGVPF